LGIAAQRKTFIINPEGRIAHVFQKVNVNRHGEDVLKILKKLNSSV
jgi:peroxiredoxin Q/BCP